MMLHSSIEHAWLREIETQGGLYMAAVQSFNEALMSPHQGVSNVFAQIQAMLNHAGMISKILWGEGRNPDPHGTHRALRQTIELDDRRWLLQSRALRNALEHYHERLRAWGPRSIVIDMNIGPKNMIAIDGTQGGALFDRHFDPETMVFSIREDNVNLQQLTDEVIEVIEVVTMSLAKSDGEAFGFSGADPY